MPIGELYFCFEKDLASFSSSLQYHYNVCNPKFILGHHSGFMYIPMALERDTNHIIGYYRVEAPETFLLLPFSALSQPLPAGVWRGTEWLKGSLWF